MVYVFLAEGFEEVEALTPLDLLRRAHVDVATVGISGRMITGSHKITVEADLTADELLLGPGVEMIVLPGGMPGTLNLEKSAAVQVAVDYCAENDKWIGAICAAPSILGHKGLLDGREAICYPGFEAQLTGATVSASSVAQDGRYVTAKGAGAAVPFGLKLVEVLKGKAEADALAAAICY